MKNVHPWWFCSIILHYLALSVRSFSGKRPETKRTPSSYSKEATTTLEKDIGAPATPPRNPEDDGFRSFRQKTPLKLQYFLRDSGWCRTLIDGLAYAGFPSIAQTYPQAVPRLFQLSGMPYKLRKLITKLSVHHSLDKEVDAAAVQSNVKFQRYAYGSHGRQIVDVMRLDSSKDDGPLDDNELVVFIHGGAWGSGFPFMYRLVASSFLRPGTTVAIVGYRTFPDASVDGQVDDVSDAIHMLVSEETNFIQCSTSTQKITLIGHSSGAHIGALALLTRNDLRGMVNSFVALSGVYHIPRHYRYEKTRGVERISPLAPACTNDRNNSGMLSSPKNTLIGWKRRSPTLILQSLPENEALHGFPKCLVCHGKDDTIVPAESAIHFAQALRDVAHKAESSIAAFDVDCTLLDCGHSDTVLHLMFGGLSRDEVLGWMHQKGSDS